MVIVAIKHIMPSVFVPSVVILNVAAPKLKVLKWRNLFRLYLFQVTSANIFTRQTSPLNHNQLFRKCLIHFEI
jgi:hypothetical protein